MMMKTAAVALCLAGGMILAQPAAHAQDKSQQEEKRDDTIDKAGKIASQPAKDIGIDKYDISPVLTKAVENPYAPPPSRSCAGLNAS